jgi:hypothetical protein
VTSHADELVSELGEVRSKSSAENSHSGSLSCYDRRLYLDIQVRRNQSVNTTLSNLAKSEKQLIVFGESHVHYDGIKRYPEFIEVIRTNRGVNCIFIEGKDNYQSAIDRYFRGDSYESTVKAINTRDPNKAPLAHATKEHMEYAKSKNIKIYAVDTENDNNSIRDKHMSRRVGYLMKETCTQPILLVGKVHVYEKLKSSHPKSTESSPIPERLRNMGYSVSSVNMISHSDLSDSYNGYSSNCPDKIDIPSRDFGFSISSPAPAIKKSAFDYLENEKWDDYQAAIVVN